MRDVGWGVAQDSRGHLNFVEIVKRLFAPLAQVMFKRSLLGLSSACGVLSQAPQPAKCAKPHHLQLSLKGSSRGVNGERYRSTTPPLVDVAQDARRTAVGCSMSVVAQDARPTDGGDFEDECSIRTRKHYVGREL